MSEIIDSKEFCRDRAIIKFRQQFSEEDTSPIGGFNYAHSSIKVRTNS